MTEITVISPDQLKNQIKETVKAVIREELSALVEPQPSAKTSYLTRQETAELLKVSALTVDQWVKKGLLLAYRIGNRVLFKSEDVEKALTAVPSLKYRRK